MNRIREKQSFLAFPQSCSSCQRRESCYNSVVYGESKVAHRVSFGFISSKSREISHFSSKGIVEGAISEKKNGEDRGKILDFERIEPKIRVINAIHLDLNEHDF
jgi:hypothetical protein